LQDEADELRESLAQLEALSGETLEALLATSRERGWLRENHGTTGRNDEDRAFAGHRVRVLASPDGYTVLLGENALANDYLVRHASSPNDWWLHARAGTSSHAIIKTNNQPDRVPPSTLRFAAEQVARRSAGKHSSVVAVDYTLRKYVRRPRNAPPGSVLREREKPSTCRRKEMSRGGCDGT
jgi:predicted ribosome quality control (RQC) complex YloA/Tae2 family protein